MSWTRSPYVAAFFAIDALEKDAQAVAVYAYQEQAGHGKICINEQAHLRVFGPQVRTHARHVLQQAEYTVAAKIDGQAWIFPPHQEVFDQLNDKQDRLWKIVLPRLAIEEARRELDEMNINAYSLFQTEDALVKTVASRAFGR
jgi:hypothetical protein